MEVFLTRKLQPKQLYVLKEADHVMKKYLKFTQDKKKTRQVSITLLDQMREDSEAVDFWLRMPSVFTPMIHLAGIKGSVLMLPPEDQQFILGQCSTWIINSLMPQWE